jgi:hypothetical protein
MNSNSANYKFDQTNRSNGTNFYDTTELSNFELILEYSQFKPIESLRESFIKSCELNSTVAVINISSFLT